MQDRKREISRTKMEGERDSEEVEREKSERGCKEEIS